MRHLRMVGLSLVAVMAIAAITASSASALPEWGKCVSQAGGKYSDGNCTVKAKKGTGTFEWTKGKNLANVKFSGGNVGSGGVLTLAATTCFGGTNEEKRVPASKCVEGGGAPESFGTIAVECESEHNTGEASGTNLILNVVVKFKGCKVFGAIPCQNSVDFEEGPQIVVNTLKGKLGYINKSTKEVGVLLEPVAKKHEFVKFDCGGVISTVVGVGNSKEGAAYTPENHGGYDGIISPITPVNTMTSKYTQVFSVNEETDENIPASFAGKHIELLEAYVFNSAEPSKSGMWSKAGEEITNENTAVEPGEIKG